MVNIPGLSSSKSERGDGFLARKRGVGKLGSHLWADVQRYRNVNSKTNLFVTFAYLDVVERHDVLVLQLLEKRNQIRLWSVTNPIGWASLNADQDYLNTVRLEHGLKQHLTFKILISFPSRIWDLERFFLLMLLMATSQSVFCWWRWIDVKKDRQSWITLQEVETKTGMIDEIYFIWSFRKYAFQWGLIAQL